MRRFFARPENITDTEITLDAEETHHLRDVLRLGVGEAANVFDGVGGEYECSITHVGRRSASLNILAETEPASPESSLDLMLAPTVLNGERYDLIVQKAVELGVLRLIPLSTIRCEVKVKDAAKRLDRWRRIALEATKQSGRARLMTIEEPVGLQELIEREYPSTVLFSERDGAPLDSLKANQSVTAIYGPKGGWDDAELAMAKAAGVTIVTLRGRILRAETASIAITAILQHRFGDMT